MSCRILLHIFAFAAVLARAAVAGGPPTPSNLVPSSGASVQVPFTISWSSVTDSSGIVAYNWQVSTSSGFGTIIAQNSTNGATQDTVSGLSNGNYFWRVQAVNGQLVQGNWSNPTSFTVTGAGASAPAVPVMGPPKGYSTFHPMETMTFNWSAVSNATTYRLEYSTNSSFPLTSATGWFDNIPDPTYTFAMGDCCPGNYFARVFAVSATGVRSQPSNVISFSVQFNNPLPPPPAPVSPANGSTTPLPVTLIWSDVPNPQPSGYVIQIAKDSGFRSIEEDAPQLNGPSREVLSLTPGTKFWRVRSAQGDSSPTTAAVTAWSTAGTFTIPNAPPTPVNIAFTTNPLASGNTTFVQVQLSAAVGAGGATISISSSNPAAAPVPATVTMPPNTAWLQFQLQAGQVTSAIPVTITASLNGGSTSAQLTIQPPTLQSLTISPSSISGGAQPQLIVMLNGEAPAGVAMIALASDSNAATPPSTVTIPPGSVSASLPITTSNVAQNTLVTVTASWNGASVSGQVTLLPQPQPASIALSPASVTGTQGSFATVTMAAASSTDAVLQVTSSNPAVASVPNSVTIPAGSTTGGFNIFTSSVTTQTTVTIAVSGGGVTRSAPLVVNASAPVPTSASLAVTATGRSGNSIVSSPAGINVPVGSTQTKSFNTGTSITLSVTNGRDAIWSGACSSGRNKTKTCVFTLQANSSVTANVQ
jgi:hypothetical protein